ncbi:glycosyltransferase family A protein [Pedobacter sp. MC2016-15]|uniref:glycosyltransferase family 2 protein n=1 Tax=Pedobacter sp. MC2016-15 TaxID=2994473 RepID=UPI002245550A|nr:glycosyltransferase family A protein [Pedobacter sp. MC2016-15]MCX2478650.1 glycosyltransferase family A protein [Pedobacter sp. MC2016-15]
MPRVSVIIPNYNHAEYLAQRINSILSQTFQDFELLILDDCSTDNSRDIIETFRNVSKVSHIVYNTENSGSTFKQWERGISLAAADLIWIAESDDWCEPNLLEELVQGFDKDNNCVISYCQSYCVYNTNEIMWVSQHPYLSELIEGHDYIKRYMLMNNSIFNASMVLWKKDLYKHVSKDFLKFKFCGDWLFWVEIAKQGTLHVSGKTLNFFRKHDKDITGAATKSGLEIIETVKVLNSMHEATLITDHEFKKGSKRLFKKYWSQKHELPSKVKSEIKNAFQSSPSSKADYNKMLLSAIWHQLGQN